MAIEIVKVNYFIDAADQEASIKRETPPDAITVAAFIHIEHPCQSRHLSGHKKNKVRRWVIVCRKCISEITEHEKLALPSYEARSRRP